MNDAIGRTKKQWHAEKAERLKSAAEKLSRLKVPYVLDNRRDRQRIMELLMETLSDRQSRVLQHLEEQYDSATRQTVAHMLSEFIAEMSDGRSTAVPMTTYETISASLQRAGVTKEVDRAHVMALLSTLAHGGKTDFRVTQHPKGGIRVTARVRPSPDSND